LLSKKNQKHKNILAETIRGTKKFQVQYWAKSCHNCFKVV